MNDHLKLPAKSATLKNIAVSKCLWSLSTGVHRRSLKAVGHRCVQRCDSDNNNNNIYFKHHSFTRSSTKKYNTGVRCLAAYNNYVS